MPWFFRNTVLLIAILPIWSITGISQPAKIRGQVTDAETGEPVGFANIYIKGTAIGVIADDSGYYYVEVRSKHDSLTATFLGYQSQSAPFRHRAVQEINFALRRSTVTLEDVIVVPGENPAHRIMRSLWANKKYHMRKSRNMQCKIYNKVQIKLSNIDEKFKQRRVLRPFQFAFENIDTSAITGKTYLPVLISETASDYYFQTNPPVEKEIVTATQISGINNESVREFVAGIKDGFDVYEDYMTFYSEPGFISPLAESGLLFYRYYLEDSVVRNGQKYYYITFKPRRKPERTFIGSCWIADKDFAVESIEMRINPDANLNFIISLWSSITFEKHESSLWLLKKEQIVVDFNYADWKRLKGLQGEKTTIYSHYILGQPIPDKVMANPQSLVFTDSSFTNKFDTLLRPEGLSHKEEKVYKMVDSIKNVPAFRTAYDLISTLVDAHINFGKFKIGPYISVYSYNEVEGHRYRIGGTTTAFFSSKVKFSGYIAYGTRDREHKYYLNSIIVLKNTPRVTLDLLHCHDVSQLNLPTGVMLNDNIVSSVLRRNPLSKLHMIDMSAITFDSDVSTWLSTKVFASYRRAFPNQYIPFRKPVTGTPVSEISAAELGFGLHFEAGMRFARSKFKRIKLRNDNPVFDITLAAAPAKFMDNKYPYWKVKLRLQHYLRTSPFGFNRLAAETGRIRGKAPWPLLEIMSGNETYGLYNYAYNMMNMYEFVADEYLSLTSEQHFQGIFLNYIPLLRMLKLREVASVKFVVGRINKRNSSLIELPPFMHTLNKPYIEVGAGVENIFKLLRIVALWRLTHKTNPDIEIFGIRARFQFML